MVKLHELSVYRKNADGEYRMFKGCLQCGIFLIVIRYDVGGEEMDRCCMMVP